MLTITSDSIGGTERPIISIKDDLLPSGIVLDVLYGEFKRNKEISCTNYNLALNFVSKYKKIYSYMPETDINNLIQEALKILYNIKEG